MSVSVQHLVKIYGAQRAVNDISFEAHKGEVLGFLGPNGAGKSTTMKVITGYLPQSEGIVKVCDFDVASAPMEARKRVGYLPEHNPLYREMYVVEYLRFMGRIHELSDLDARIREMIDRTGLQSHRSKRIRELSKGYRQRVGLAQALLHNPQVLILDEPTSGLDPNQIVEIRQLIRDLGREKTVILSTHILGEVEAVCDRAVIINKGKLVANASIAELQQQFSGQNIITIEVLGKTNEQALRSIQHVTQVRKLSEQRWQLVSPAQYDIRAEVFAFAVANQLTLLELHKELFSVEDIFHQLTR
jgi:ABC-2 type transport system ATP-binding protein